MTGRGLVSERTSSLKWQASAREKKSVHWWRFLSSVPLAQTAKTVYPRDPPGEPIQSLSQLARQLSNHSLKIE
ncbi:hypothetical protein Cabys_3318 [Caldithrix abyssi DSM 13497]|uniref:Uncharacterized protein n=1 Tax=Caldithrix abyssi DSM 13497 TaxID=880073 RepID=A0A1J1CDK3_CALAY|nr:hypothetical protein Cabys_3318 [Caldithrix abyssi DSM 13497]